MQFLLIIPGLLSLYYVMRGQLNKAFLNVYLPCTFLLPYYYVFRIPHLATVSTGSAALLPIGISLLINPKTNWRFRRMDLWIVAYVVSFAVSEVMREHDTNIGMSLWFSSGFIDMFLGYVVGRQIIEPALRLEMIKRIVFLFLCLTPFALYEYRFGQNLWINFGPRLFGTQQHPGLQLRGGIARIGLCFGGPIIAAMLILIVIALNYYLVQIYKLNKTGLGPWMSKLQKYRLPFLILPVFLYMTGSRMPQACTVLAFLILQIPRFKSMRTGVIVVLLVVAVGGGTTYEAFEKYTSVSDDQVADEAQSSAIYRKTLLVNYAPILEAGGWLGWGQDSIPVVPGQASIDNAFMLIQLSQGKLGVDLFKIIILESIFGLVLCAARFKSRESRFLVFSLIGALIGIFVSLYTVYLGEQVTQVLFMLMGWSQSLQDTRVFGAAETASSALLEPKFRFKRVIN